MNENDLKAIFNPLNDIPLPNREKILAAAKALPSSQTSKTTLSRRKHRPTMHVLVAACLSILMLVSVLGICAAAVEQYEYHAAVSFFEQHNLPIDGYSRREIKLIWKDITSGSFSYEKTQDMLTAGVGGYEIAGEPLSPEDLQALWQTIAELDEINQTNIREGFAVSGKISPDGISFRYKNQIRYAETAEDAYAVLEQYRDGSLIWEKTLSGITIVQLAYTEKYLAMAVIVPGGNALLLCTPEGEEICRIAYDLPCHALLADEDSVSLVCANREQISLRTYDLQGSCLHAANSSFAAMGLDEVKNTVGSVLRLEGQYLLQLTDENDTDYLIKIDEGGNLLGEFRYSMPGEIYCFTDMASCCGDLYISGYTIPDGSRPQDELYALKQQIIAAEGKISPATLTKQLKANYTAILLKCSGATGRAEAFYSLPGALGDHFTLAPNGNLVWQVHEIESAEGSYISVNGWSNTPGASIDSVCSVVTFTFDQNGIMTGQQRTGEAAALNK